MAKGAQVEAAAGPGGGWQDAEAAIGRERGVDAEGNPVVDPTADFAGNDTDTEIDRIRGLASSRRRVHEQLTREGKGIGWDPRFAEGADQDEAPAAAPRRAQQRPRRPTRAAQEYDPSARPDLEGQQGQNRAAEEFMDQEEQGEDPAVDPADAEFFQLPAQMDDGSGLTVADDGQVTLPAATYARWQQDLQRSRAEVEQVRQERHDMGAAMSMLKANTVRTMQAMGKQPQEILAELQEMGLAAPNGASPATPAAEDFASVRLDDEADPALVALSNQNRVQASRIQRLEGTLEGLVDRLERRDAAQDQREYARERAARLSGVKGMLTQTAGRVPALRKHGHGPLLVKVVMGELERDYDRLPKDTDALNKRAVGMLRSAAQEIGLSPQARAHHAKAESSRQAAPVPTRAGRQPRPRGARQPHQEEPFDFRNEDLRRQRGLRWLEANAARFTGE